MVNKGGNKMDIFGMIMKIIFAAFMVAEFILGLMKISNRQHGEQDAWAIMYLVIKFVIFITLVTNGQFF